MEGRMDFLNSISDGMGLQIRDPDVEVIRGPRVVTTPWASVKRKWFLCSGRSAVQMHTPLTFFKLTPW
jgi:hypothetical protein